MFKNLACLLLLLINGNLFSQHSFDSSITENRKNVIRINPTPTAIVGLKSFVLGYERVIKPHQSISVNIGRLKFRKFVDLGLDNYGINSTRKSGGYSLAIDYRRYFKKRNRGFAPDGLYWGAFYTYYWYKHDLGLTYTDPSAIATSGLTLDSELRVYHFGLQLGYQFVIKKRLVLDLIFIGPSWGKYRADFQIEGDLNIDEENELIKEYFGLLKDRYPGLSSLVEDRKLSTSGHFSTNTFGMRYVFQLGFLF